MLPPCTRMAHDWNLIALKLFSSLLCNLKKKIPNLVTKKSRWRENCHSPSVDTGSTLYPLKQRYLVLKYHDRKIVHSAELSTIMQKKKKVELHFCNILKICCQIISFKYKIPLWSRQLISKRYRCYVLYWLGFG